VADNRANFSQFGVAMLTCFQMLSGENWNEVLYAAIENTGYWAVLYFLPVVTIGMFIVLNLFVAILLSTFDSESMAKDETGPKEPPKKKNKKTTMWQTLRANSPVCCFCCARSAKPVLVGDAAPEDEDHGVAIDQVSKKEAADAKTNDAAAAAAAPPPPAAAAAAPAPLDRTAQGLSRMLSMVEDEEKEKAVRERQMQYRNLKGLSLGLFPPGKHTKPGAFRHYTAKFVTHWAFDAVIIACIVVSSALLAVDTPLLDEKSDTAKALMVVDIIFTVIFCVEMLLKIVV